MKKRHPENIKGLTQKTSDEKRSTKKCKGAYTKDL
jgi:hypothetical protein